MSKSSKGSSFERQLCKEFSLWWTDGKRNDVFWRSAGSGAMAKTRSKTGGRAFGQHGDFQATDPIGQPLIDVCTVELKRGYSKTSIGDLLDKPARAAQQGYEKFIQQAMYDSQLAGSMHWLLVVRRDKRVPLVIMPRRLQVALGSVGAFESTPIPYFRMKINLKHDNKKVSKITVCGTTLEGFFDCVKPKHFIKLAKGKL